MNKEEKIIFRISAKDKQEFIKKIGEYDPSLKVSQVLQIMVRSFNKEGFKSLSK